MAWWGPGFEPTFNIAYFQNDLDIVNQGIVKIEERTASDEQLEADHKVVWDYWNPMCGYLDDYLPQASGLIMQHGPLVDLNVTTMANGNNDPVIYQISDPAPNGDVFYTKLYPNNKYLYGPVSPYSPLTIALEDDEPWWIDHEQLWKLDEDGSGNYQDNSAERLLAQNGEVASISSQTTALASLIGDLSDGVIQYPELQDLIDYAGQVIVRCNIAKAAAEVEIAASSPPSSAARISFLIDRETEVSQDYLGLDAEGAYVRQQRYMWTDLRCNISRGTYGNIQANTDALARLEAEKIRLELLISQYEMF